MSSFLNNLIVLYFLQCHTQPIGSSSSRYHLIQNSHQKEPIENVRTECKQLFGTDLASIHNHQDMIDARSLCVSSGESACWIGLLRNLSSSARYNTFYWSDGSEWDFGNFHLNNSNWSIGAYPWGGTNPNNIYICKDCTEDCVQMIDGYDYQWADVSCDLQPIPMTLCNVNSTESPVEHPITTATAHSTPMITQSNTTTAHFTLMITQSNNTTTAHSTLMITQSNTTTDRSPNLASNKILFILIVIIVVMGFIVIILLFYCDNKNCVKPNTHVSDDRILSKIRQESIESQDTKTELEIVEKQHTKEQRVDAKVHKDVVKKTQSSIMDYNAVTVDLEGGSNYDTLDNPEKCNVTIGAMKHDKIVLGIVSTDGDQYNIYEGGNKNDKEDTRS